MAHGTRGRFGRTACLGLGLVICSTLVGCMDNDKKPLSGKPATTGLPGTPTVNGTGMPQNRTVTGQQPNWNVNGQPAQNGNQPGGSFANQPSNAFQPTGGLQNPTRGAMGPTGTPTLPGTYQQQQPNIPSVTPTSSVTPSSTNATAYRGQVDPQFVALSTDIQPPMRDGPVPSVTPASAAPLSPPTPSPNYGNLPVPPISPLSK